MIFQKLACSVIICFRKRHQFALIWAIWHFIFFDMIRNEMIRNEMFPEICRWEQGATRCPFIRFDHVNYGALKMCHWSCKHWNAAFSNMFWDCKMLTVFHLKTSPGLSYKHLEACCHSQRFRKVSSISLVTQASKSRQLTYQHLKHVENLKCFCEMTSI